MPSTEHTKTPHQKNITMKVKKISSMKEKIAIISGFRYFHCRHEIKDKRMKTVLLHRRQFHG